MGNRSQKGFKMGKSPWEFGFTPVGKIWGDSRGSRIQKKKESPTGI